MAPENFPKILCIGVRFDDFFNYFRLGIKIFLKKHQNFHIVLNCEFKMRKF